MKKTKKIVTIAVEVAGDSKDYVESVGKIMRKLFRKQVTCYYNSHNVLLYNIERCWFEEYQELDRIEAALWEKDIDFLNVYVRRIVDGDLLIQ